MKVKTVRTILATLIIVIAVLGGMHLVVNYTGIGEGLKALHG